MADRFSANHARSGWLVALRTLAIACADGEPEDVAHCLRDINTLLCEAPQIALTAGVLPLGSARMEALLAADAHDTAIMAMLDHGAGYMVSRGGDGQSLATVALPNALHDESGTGATPALALIGALALSLSTAAKSASVTSPRAVSGTRMALH